LRVVQNMAENPRRRGSLREDDFVHESGLRQVNYIVNNADNFLVAHRLQIVALFEHRHETLKTVTDVPQ
jgi:hypothetical protein